MLANIDLKPPFWRVFNFDATKYRTVVLEEQSLNGYTFVWFVRTASFAGICLDYFVFLLEYCTNIFI